MNITITSQDFELLRENDMSWEDIARHSADLEHRFEWLEGKHTLNPWKRIYWLGREYTAVILARTFLESYGHPYEVAWDNAGEWEKPPFGYVILTDYERES